MRIAILSEIDYAASAYNIFQALKRHTNYDINLFSGPPQNNLKHPINCLVTEKNRLEVQEYVNSADILHFKGDWPPQDGYLGLKIPDKPIIITTSGSFFRKQEFGGLGKYSNADYGRAILKTSFTTDLLYPEYSDIWTPLAIDSDDKVPLARNMDDPIFMHIPSMRIRKRTDFVEHVFSILHGKMKCRTEIIEGILFLEASETKKRATIYFDQFMVGFYGNSALEAMQWGIPVVNWISPMAIEQAKGKLDGCPLINADMDDPEKTAQMVIDAMNDDTIGERTKKWCDEKHGYKAIARQWSELYKSIL